MELILVAIVLVSLLPLLTSARRRPEPVRVPARARRRARR